MSAEIKEVIEGIEKNIRSILLSKEFTLEDAKMILIDLLGTFKDLWKKFDFIFEKVGKIIEIEESTKKGELYIEESSEENNGQTQDFGRIFI
ncbi:MAG: hypothetical protein ACFFCE_05675 [Promethearchaeota archaeon]